MISTTIDYYFVPEPVKYECVMPVYAKVTGFYYFLHPQVHIQVKAGNRKPSVLLMGPHESREGELHLAVIEILAIID